MGTDPSGHSSPSTGYYHTCAFPLKPKSSWRFLNFRQHCRPLLTTRADFQELRWLTLPLPLGVASKIGKGVFTCRETGNDTSPFVCKGVSVFTSEKLGNLQATCDTSISINPCRGSVTQRQGIFWPCSPPPTLRAGMNMRITFITTIP